MSPGPFSIQKTKGKRKADARTVRGGRWQSVEEVPSTILRSQGPTGRIEKCQPGTVSVGLAFG